MSIKLFKLILKVIPIMVMTLFVACPNRGREDFKPELNIFAVLRNDRSEQKFNIDRTYAMDDTVEYDLQNVYAVVYDDSLCDTLRQYFDYIWWGFDHPVQPAHTYRIMVCAEGLDTLWGETTIPGAFNVIFPQPGDTVLPGDTILIRKSEGGKVYEFQFYQGDTIPYLAGSFPDFLPDSFFRFPASDLGLLEGYQAMSICAYDSNYFNYQYNFGGGEYPRCGVSGGLGAFCGAYENSVNFYFQP
jgi:hypothetical protein